jgi:hypothetical protein
MILGSAQYFAALSRGKQLFEMNPFHAVRDFEMEGLRIE